MNLCKQSAFSILLFLMCIWEMLPCKLSVPHKQKEKPAFHLPPASLASPSHWQGMMWLCSFQGHSEALRHAQQHLLQKPRSEYLTRRQGKSRWLCDALRWRAQTNRSVAFNLSTIITKRDRTSYSKGGILLSSGSQRKKVSSICLGWDTYYAVYIYVAENQMHLRSDF